MTSFGPKMTSYTTIRVSNPDLVMALLVLFEVFSFCLGTRGFSGRVSTELVFDSSSKFSKFGSTRFLGDRA